MAIKQINGKKTKLYHIYDFPGGLDGKESVMQKTWFQSLAYDTLEKGMAAHFSILIWRIPWTEEPGGLFSSWGLKESDANNTYTYLLYIWGILRKTG